MRLTYKTDNGAYTGVPSQIPVRKALEKLSRLEDIEEKLGVDLSLYLKMTVLWSDVYIKSEMGILELKHKRFGYVDGKFWEIGRTTDLALDPKDYGKTWALTKEELQ